MSRSSSTISACLPARNFPAAWSCASFVPQGHKVALADIAEGAPIRRYGEVIGTRRAPIQAGEWVDEARIRMPDAARARQAANRDRRARAAAAARGLHVRGLSQPGRLGRHQEHAGASRTTRAMRRRHAGVRHQAHQGRAAAAISQCRRRGRRSRTPTAAASRSTRPMAMVPIRTLQNLALQSEFRRRGHGRRPRLREARARAAACRAATGDAIVRMQDEAFDGFGAIVDAHHGDGGGAAGVLNTRTPRDLPGLRSRGRPAMRRQRRLFRRHRQSRRRLCRRSAGARRRHRDVLRSDRSARRHPSADAPRRQRGGRPRAGPRNGLVRRLSRPRRRRPQRQHHARQQEGRPRQHRREVAGLDRQVRHERRSSACCRRARRCARRA